MTSMISKVRLGACQARMSTDPRSPNWLNVNSGRTSQFVDLSAAMVWSTNHVGAVEQSVSLTAPPIGIHRDRYLELHGDAPKRREANRLQATQLEVGHHFLAHVSPYRDIGLSKIGLMPCGPQKPSDVPILHARMIPAASLPTLT